MKPLIRFVLALIVTMAFAFGSATGQIIDTAKVYVWPPELYTGANELTLFWTRCQVPNRDRSTPVVIRTPAVPVLHPIQVNAPVRAADEGH